MNFNKRIQVIFFSLIVITGFDAKCQDLLKPKFGLRAGASFSTIFGPEEDGVFEQHKTTVRVAAGATIKVPFHEQFGVSAEVVFVQKGSYFTASADNSY